MGCWAGHSRSLEGPRHSVTGAGSAAQLWRPRVKERHCSECSGLTHKHWQTHVNATGYIGITQSNCSFFLIWTLSRMFSPSLSPIAAGLLQCSAPVTSLVPQLAAPPPYTCTQFPLALDPQIRLFPPYKACVLSLLWSLSLDPLHCNKLFGAPHKELSLTLFISSFSKRALGSGSAGGSERLIVDTPQHPAWPSLLLGAQICALLPAWSRAGCCFPAVGMRLAADLVSATRTSRVGIKLYGTSVAVKSRCCLDFRQCLWSNVAFRLKQSQNLSLCQEAVPASA